ncbi:hypothetical protein PG985_015338 [Apiospora marii]|uniref:uncharacterized protein n=1 Tax=Apiospora marii TaxID=335849 RepID=UPI00312D46D9
MAGQYSYPPPPPPPPAAAPSGGYPSYGQSPSYSHAPRGGGSGGMGANRGRGGHHGPPYGSYSHQEFAGHSPAQYGSQTPSGYWSSPAQPNHSPHSNAPLPPSTFHPSYAPQGYNAPPPSNYPPRHIPKPTTVPGSGVKPGQPTPPYSNRGGRGGFQSDRGGHRPDHGSGPAIRMGFDQSAGHATQASNGYAQHYPSPQHHAPSVYPPPPYPSYPPVPAPAYSGPAHTPYSHNNSNRGRGRDGPGAFRGRSHHNDRGGDKFRHRGQRPHHDHSPAQKSDPSSSKKKKRKTNTLGLTPGDGEESEEESVDEEKRLSELLGADAPVVDDMASWVAERRANFPTKARVEAKKAAEAAQRAEVGEDQKPVTKLDKDEEKAEKLRRQLAKVERKLEKRKREANDEGDEMRVDGAESSSSDSEDEKPESLPTRKASSFLPPPPIIRADPTNHCKYYSTGGICGKKGKCRFVHDNLVREQALREQAANGGRMTLKQRLLRNDKDQEDLAIVRSIMDLRTAGRLATGQPATNQPSSSSQRPVHPLPQKVVDAAALPPAPDVLPDGRVKSAYISTETRDMMNELKPYAGHSGN